MKSIVLIVSSFLCLLASPDQPAEETSAAVSGSYDSYKVIYEYNIFSKNRRSPRSNQRRTRRTRTTQVLSVYVLRGIAAEAGKDQRYAFVEEEVAGQTQTATVGTEILAGQITGIQMNYVLYEENGQTRKIHIGEQFGKTSKTVTSEVSADESETSSTDSSSETSDQPSSGDENDVLKKMLERRKRELGT